MNQFEEKIFNRALNSLRALNCKYAVLAPNAQRYGDWDILEEMNIKKFAHGEVTKYIAPLLENIEVGESRKIPWEDYQKKVLTSAIYSWFYRTHGTASAVTNRNNDDKCIDVMRIL
jgi:hypothetical protein